MTYTPPIKDMKFALKNAATIDELIKLNAYEHATSDLIDAVLEEASKLSSNVWAETNVAGDKQGNKLENSQVKTPEGFKEAYKQFAEGGWKSVTSNQDHGGMGMPHALGMAIDEMWQSANLALSLCPLLSQAAIEAIEKHGTDEQKNMYLSKLISGEWTGTMQLTEPQAGTDLAAITSVAKKDGDHYLLSGQKIFITWGEHDFTDNIIHLVLARVDGLPEGNDGLGLFIVPKFLVNADGSLGERNDVKATALEHKLGIHASPTCVMSYGDAGGAKAYLVGDEGKGLRNMFTMMNSARISVGLQGVALSERAYQHALAYAKDRIQCSRLGDAGGKRVAIIEHADIRRMLLTMKSTTEASRALAYYAGSMIDRMRKETDQIKIKQAELRVDFLTPIVKAWSTDLAVENSSLGVQVFGGMGFIEEAGAAQHYRDARILPIYEGTNGIQANDFVFRKVLRDNAAEANKFIDEMHLLVKEITSQGSEDLEIIGSKMSKALENIEEVASWVTMNAKTDIEGVAASSVMFLKMFSMVAGGYMMAKMAAAAHKELLSDSCSDPEFYKTKIVTAKFYCEAILPQVRGMMLPIMGGHSSAIYIGNDNF